MPCTGQPPPREHPDDGVRGVDTRRGTPPAQRVPHRTRGRLRTHARVAPPLVKPLPRRADRSQRPGRGCQGGGRDPAPPWECQHDGACGGRGSGDRDPPSHHARQTVCGSRQSGGRHPPGAARRRASRTQRQQRRRLMGRRGKNVGHRKTQGQGRHDGCSLACQVEVP